MGVFQLVLSSFAEVMTTFSVQHFTLCGSFCSLQLNECPVTCVGGHDGQISWLPPDQVYGVHAVCNHIRIWATDCLQLVCTSLEISLVSHKAVVE